MTRITHWARDRHDTITGAWGILGPESATILATTPFDWIGLDAQHGLFNPDNTLRALHVIPPDRADVLVRVPDNDAAWIGRVLDAGARGVIVPMVETVAEAQAAAAACRYPPLGRRSLGQFGEPWAWAEVPTDEANERVVCAVMVETSLGLENVDAIAAVSGIDMIVVGPFDLSLGIGQSLEQTMAMAGGGPLGTIARACRDHDVIAGAFAGTGERAITMRAIGYQALALASDVRLLRTGTDAILTEFSATAGEPTLTPSNGAPHPIAEDTAQR